MLRWNTLKSNVVKYHIRDLVKAQVLNQEEAGLTTDLWSEGIWNVLFSCVGVTRRLCLHLMEPCLYLSSSCCENCQSYTHTHSPTPLVASKGAAWCLTELCVLGVAVSSSLSCQADLRWQTCGLLSYPERRVLQQMPQLHGYPAHLLAFINAEEKGGDCFRGPDLNTNIFK